MMPRQRDQITNTSSNSQGQASSAMQRKVSLLTLPLEIRQEVYDYLAYDTHGALLDLLTTSRRIAKEVEPFLYKKPPLFDGQYQLFDWLENVDHDYLPCVTEISIKLVDVDPETIVGALGKRLREAKANREPLRAGPQDNPYYEACYQDLKRIQKAFSLLPGVRTLRILEAQDGDTHPPAPMLENFSKMLGHCFPNISAIVNALPLFPIDFIANKPKLRRLRFPANSESSEDETAALCRKLPLNLHLEIFRQDTSGDSDTYQWGCITEMLSNLPPIRALSLLEAVEEQPSDLLDEVFIVSMDSMKRHLRSMRKLSILADPPADAQKASLLKRNLLRFFEASQLRHVEVLGTYTSIYRHLPGSVEKFVLRLDRWCCEADNGGLEDVLDEFLEHVKFRAVNKQAGIPKLSHLRAIEVWLHWHEELFEPEEEEEEEDARTLEARIRKQLQKIGVHFKLVVKQPVDDIFDE